MSELWHYFVQAFAVIGAATASVAIITIVGLSLVKDGRPIDEVLIAGGLVALLLSGLIFLLWVLSHVLGLWEDGLREWAGAQEAENSPEGGGRPRYHRSGGEGL